MDSACQRIVLRGAAGLLGPIKIPIGIKIGKAGSLPNNASRAFAPILINYYGKSHRDGSSDKEISWTAGTGKFPRLFDDKADSNMDSFRRFIFLGGSI
ncbi:MAG: hypothetical protein ACREE4_12550 [Stellaceae bacterium]